jgi:hypothetical protein
MTTAGLTTCAGLTLCAGHVTLSKADCTLSNHFVCADQIVSAAGTFADFAGNLEAASS